MPKLAAADVVGAEFGDEPGIEANHLLDLACPSALAAWRAAGEAGPALQRFEQFRDFGGVIVDPRMADEVQQAVIAVEAEEQAVDGAGRLVLVVAGKNGVHRMPDLELAHDPLARTIRLVERFRHDAVESCAGLRQPFPCRGSRPRSFRQHNNPVLTGGLHESLQRLSPFGKGPSGQVADAVGQKIENDQPRRKLARQFGNPARCRMKAQLQAAGLSWACFFAGICQSERRGSAKYARRERSSGDKWALTLEREDHAPALNKEESMMSSFAASQNGIMEPAELADLRLVFDDVCRRNKTARETEAAQTTARKLFAAYRAGVRDRELLMRLAMSKASR